MQAFEVEVKTLLGDAKKAETLRRRMREVDADTKLISKNVQLNHYFIDGDLSALSVPLEGHLSPEARAKLEDLAGRAKSFSLRTRDKDGTVLLVLKASVGDDTSANGVARMEFEEKVALSLETLDELVQKAGFRYQAKWSRGREEYLCKVVAVCLDKNAGYGWLAEFEQVVQNEGEVEAARTEIYTLMRECGVEELPQERLERMFAFYNTHWPDYYGTDKIFTVA